MRYEVLLSLLASCYQPPVQPTPPPHVTAASRDVLEAALDHSVVGRVLLDGTPVTEFGVAPSSNAAVPMASTMMMFRNGEGRFSIHVPVGTWDLVIVGPGFARHVVRNVVVDRDQVVLPLTVEVAHGDVLEGQVSDGAGNPVLGAEVRVSQGPKSTDRFADLAAGNYNAVTDKNGRFRIDDFVVAGKDTNVSARWDAGRLASLDSKPVVGTAIAIVMLPAGTVRVTLDPTRIPSLANCLVVAREQTTSTRRWAFVDPSGEFIFPLLPVGDYKFDVYETGESPLTLTKTVKVTAGHNPITIP